MRMHSACACTVRARAGPRAGARAGARAGLQQEAELVRLDVEPPVVRVRRHHAHRLLRAGGGGQLVRVAIEDVVVRVAIESVGVGSEAMPSGAMVGVAMVGVAMEGVAPARGRW